MDFFNRRSWQGRPRSTSISPKDQSLSPKLVPKSSDSLVRTDPCRRMSFLMFQVVNISLNFDIPHRLSVPSLTYRMGSSKNPKISKIFLTTISHANSQPSRDMLIMSARDAGNEFWMDCATKKMKMTSEMKIYPSYSSTPIFSSPVARLHPNGPLVTAEFITIGHPSQYIQRGRL